MGVWTLKGMRFNHSEETKAKISKNNAKYWLGKKRVLSDEWKKNIGEGNKGHIVSEETREKLHKRFSKKVEVECGFCKIKVLKHLFRIKNYKRLFCSKECRVIAQKGYKHSELSKTKLRGENHPHYIKDRSLLKKSDRRQDDVAIIYWRKSIYGKDKYKCQIFNKDCKGRIEAHHILPWSEYPELRYEIKNGITLCQYHHPKKRDEVQRLIPFFQSMVEVREVNNVK